LFNVYCLNLEFFIYIQFCSHHCFLLNDKLYQMVRKKKPVWEHFLKTESEDDRKHPSVRCKHCDKSYKRAVPKRMQAHLDECSNAPNNAKSQNITSIDDFDDRINEEKKSFDFLPAKALGPIPFIDDPLVIQWYQKETN